MVSGGFNFKIIKSFIPIFFEESNVLNNILKQNYDLKSNECDISSPISMATMEMIGKTALGVKFNAQNGGRHRFVENLQTAMIVRECCYIIILLFIHFKYQSLPIILGMGIQNYTSMVFEQNIIPAFIS